MQDNGAALIAMHARTKTQQYGGQADWEAIACLREVVTVPVIGNGDVQTPHDIERLKAQTGCDAVMIGRAAIGNPWIFAGKEKADLTLADKMAAVRRHAREMADYFGESHGLVLFRKHLKRYLADEHCAKGFLPQLLRMTNLVDLEALLSEVEIQTVDLYWKPFRI